MVRKVLIGGMALVMMSSFVSAAAAPVVDDAEAVEIYQTALTKMFQLTNYEMTVENTTAMQVQGGASAAVERHIRLQMNEQGQEAMQFLMTRLDTAGDQQQTAIAFYTEGKLYLEKDGDKTVQALPPAEALDYSAYSWLRMLPDVMLLEDIYVSGTDEAGNVELTYTCAKEISNELLSSETRYINEYAGKVVINAEGYLINATIWTDVEMLINEQLVKADAETIITFDNPGQTVTFTIPSRQGY